MNKMLQYQSILQNPRKSGTIFSADVQISGGQVIFQYKHGCIPVYGVDGSLHFTLPSMNRLNQNEPATFAILLFWGFLGVLFFTCVLKLSLLKNSSRSLMFSRQIFYNIGQYRNKSFISRSLFFHLGLQLSSLIDM